MTHTSNKAFGWRMLLMIPVAVMAVLSIVATGHDDSDNGELPDPPEIPATILPSYNYEIGSQVGDLTLNASVSGIGSIDVAFGDTLRGSINLDVSGAGEVTLLNYVTDAGSTLAVTLESIALPEIDGTYTINVTEALSSTIFDPPTSGAFEVVSSLGPSVSVSITGTGVSVTIPGNPVPFEYTWDEFMDLVDSEDPIQPELRAAALATGILEFVYEFFLNAADVLDELEVIVATSPVVEECDMFMGSPPEGALAQGEAVVTYLGTGDLFPGDSFEWNFTDCWFEDFDELRNGFFQLSNYIEEVDADNNLTQIGFAPSGGTNGGISFFGYRIEETVELTLGVYAIDPLNVVVVNGGFSVLFTAP